MFPSRQRELVEIPDDNMSHRLKYQDIDSHIQQKSNKKKIIKNNKNSKLKFIQA